MTNPILEHLSPHVEYFHFDMSTRMTTIDGNENLVVGAHVKGTADNPQITLFSNPNNLSQKDILSYLVYEVNRLTNSQETNVESTTKSCTSW